MSTYGDRLDQNGTIFGYWIVLCYHLGHGYSITIQVIPSSFRPTGTTWSRREIKLMAARGRSSRTAADDAPIQCTYNSHII